MPKDVLVVVPGAARVMMRFLCPCADVAAALAPPAPFKYRRVLLAAEAIREGVSWAGYAQGDVEIVGTLPEILTELAIDAMEVPRAG